MRDTPYTASPPPVRSALVGVVMLALLCGSLGLSWAVTGAAWRPPVVPERAVVPIAGATLSLPGAWTLETVSEQAGQPILQWMFTNRASPAERLRVVRFTATEATDPVLVMGKFVLPQLVAGRLMKAAPRREVGKSDAGEIIDLVFTTQRISTVTTSPQLHAVRMLTPDRKNFWVFQLTDQVPDEEWDQSLEIGQIEQLRRLLDSFAYQRETAD